MASKLEQKSEGRSLSKKSIKISKKKKMLQKDNLQHCNPQAIIANSENVIAKQDNQFKKKKRKKNKKPKQTTENNDVNKPENKLIEIKNSVNDLSSNWKNLMKTLPKEEENKEQISRPAFLRRNKKGQIITNQKMSHPKAVIVGQPDQKKKNRLKKTEEPTVKDDEVWFDDVDPTLLETVNDPNSDNLVKNNSFKGVTKILGMDCEMVGVGNDGVDSILARVSIVNHFGNVLYDKFVAPREKVTDYRTAVSGVRPEDLVNAPEFKLVQEEVAELIKDRVLVGHALHHDLKVLFLDHPKKLIRDTSKYKPFKAAFGGRTPGLKALTERFLGVKVQTGEHSSVQDSQAAIRLYTMFRKDWEADRTSKMNKNKNSKKKKQSKTETVKIEPSRILKAKEASKSIGSRPLYAPSDSEED